MDSAVTINCPRCKKSFPCNARDVHDCACIHVQLQPVTREYLAKTNFGCLCNDCLVQLNEMVTLAAQTPFPKDGKELTEGLHYYMEGGLMVFTEFYHIQRGYCCEKGCRHCAYKS